MTEPARVLVGRYALLRELGRGAMGVVWLARDELLRREVAVKQLLLPLGLGRAAADEARARAMREARIAARLHHPNAISVFDVVTEDGEPWLVMEYLPSRSLAEVIAAGPLAPADAARVGASAAAALAAAHELGIVHRDVKPANVLLGDRGAVKITDFGIARASGDVAVTQAGMLAGTPAYLSPEVAMGAAPEPPSDVFSLGATLYAAVEGRPPFGLGDSSLAMLHRVASGQYEPPRRAGRLSGVLGRLLQTDPRARPTAAQAAGLLGEVERGEPAVTQPASQPPTRLILGQPPSTGGTRLAELPPQRRSRLLPSLVGGLLLAIMAALVVVALNLRGVAGDPMAPSTSTAPPPNSGPPATTVTQTTPPSTAPPTTAVTFSEDDVAEFVTEHYAALPEDTATAWENLTREFRPAYPDYVAFWSGFDDVELADDPEVSADASGFTAAVQIEFVPAGGDDSSVEAYLVHVVVRDGRLLIDRTTKM